MYYVYEKDSQILSRKTWMYIHFFIFSLVTFLVLFLVAVLTGGNMLPNSASNASFLSVLLATFGVPVFAGAEGGAFATGELLKLAGLGGSNRPSLRVDPGEYGDDMSTTLSFAMSIVVSLPFCPIVELFFWVDLDDRAMVDDFAEFVNVLGSCGLSFVRCLIWLLGDIRFDCKNPQNP